MKNSQIAEGADISLEVIIKATQFRKGNYLVLRAHEGGLVFGQVQFMITDSCRKVHFLVKEGISELSGVHMYILPDDNSTAATFKFIEYSNLLDYYPLSAYKTGKSLMTPLKHAVST